MTPRRRWCVIGTALCALGIPVAEPADAVSTPTANRWTARCWSVGVTTIAGGLRLLEDARVTAVGHSAPHCIGRVRGHDVTGAGELESNEVIEGSCRGGRGVADIRMTIPTSGGVQEVRALVPFVYTGAVGVGHSTVLSENLIVVLAAVEGDCVTAPATKLQYWDTFAINT